MMGGYWIYPACMPVMSQDCTESVHLLLMPVQVTRTAVLRETTQQTLVSLRLVTM